MGKASRTKGHSFERKLAKIFMSALGIPFKRGIQFRYGAKEGCDVEGSSIFHIEAKRHKLCNIRAALRQAEADCAEDGKGRIPIAVTKDDRGPILVTLNLEHFLPMMQIAHYLFHDSESGTGNNGSGNKT